MNLRNQLIALQKTSGMTQAQIAHDLGVTTVALNRWVNERAIPRPKMQEKINAIYRQHVEKTSMNDVDLLTSQKKYLAKKSVQTKNVLQKILNNPDIIEQFELLLTYHTNSLEGSTLSEGETAMVLFHNAALPDKTLIEQLEAKNHQTAIRFVFRHLIEEKLINEELILKIHSILMNGIRDDAGRYRTHGVRIVGTFVPTANPIKVPFLMEELGKRMSKKISKDVLGFVARTHAEFEQIHPFSDGNGRTGRLLACAILLQENYPPAVTKKEIKRDYLSALAKAQLSQDFTPIERIICDAVMEGYGIVERK